MGGIERLRAVESISYQSLSHTFFRTVEISNSSPQMMSYESDEVLLQPHRSNLRAKVSWKFTEAPVQVESQLIFTSEGGFAESGDKKVAPSADQFYKAIDTLAANPIAALTAAYDSNQLSIRRQSDDTFELSFPQSIYGIEVKTSLGMSRQTHALQWIEIEHSYSQDAFNAFWGPTAKRYVFSAWMLDASGIRFPGKWQVEAHDEVEGQESLVNFKLNPDKTAATFTIPDEFKKAYEAFHKSEDDLAKANHGDGLHLDLQEGVTMLPGKQGAYNALIVKQEKGVVVIEAPYSNANSEYVMQYARRLYPDVPVSAVLTTDHLRMHMGGLPAYVKASIPLYVLDANAGTVRNFLTKQTTGDPIRESSLRLRTVKGRLEMGSGANRMLLLPFRGVASARMMAVYFPEQKLLYCSDLFMPQNWEKDHWTEHLSEIRELIKGEHIEVRKVLGVSAVPKDWNELVATVPGEGW